MTFDAQISFLYVLMINSKWTLDESFLLKIACLYYGKFTRVIKDFIMTKFIKSKKKLSKN
jgi:hypothetical protein